MASTKLVRKARVNIGRQKVRRDTIQRLLATPVIKKIDVDALKKEFAANPKPLPVEKKEKKAAAPKAEKKPVEAKAAKTEEKAPKKAAAPKAEKKPAAPKKETKAKEEKPKAEKKAADKAE